MKALVACLAIFSLCCGSASAVADVSGARVQAGNWDVQFVVEDVGNEAIRALLFGSGGAVERTALLFSTGGGEVKSGGPKDLTLHLRSSITEGLIDVDITSNIPALENEETLALRKSDAGILVEVVCGAFGLADCQVEKSAHSSPSVIAPREKVAGAPQSEFLLIEIGNLPTEDAEDQIVFPYEQNLEAFPGETFTLPAAIDRVADDLYSEETGAGERLEPSDELEAARKREFFVVHCTAFGAQDNAMRKWVNRNKRGNVRSKSHGVILPSGEWLQMWDFDERRVWATKTETCKDTANQALGSSINIELHYFCASNRDDHASQEQYQKLAELYITTAGKYGPLAVVSHKEFDRGLRNAHNDPIGFDFEHFYAVLRGNGVDISAVKRISSVRHQLPTASSISHHWRPSLAGSLVFESERADDCKRDHR